MPPARVTSKRREKESTSTRRGVLADRPVEGLRPGVGPVLEALVRGHEPDRGRRPEDRPVRRGRGEARQVGAVVGVAPHRVGERGARDGLQARVVSLGHGGSRSAGSFQAWLEALPSFPRADEARSNEQDRHDAGNGPVEQVHPEHADHLLDALAHRLLHHLLGQA